jgi:small subunit ribosomal protein S1
MFPRSGGLFPMAQGTQLGAFEPTQDTDTFQKQTLQATKIGERSDLDPKMVEEVNAAEKARRESLSDFELAMEEMISEFHPGDLVKGIVRTVEKSGVIVDIGYKSDAFIPNNEFSNDPNLSPESVLKPGDEVSGVIEKLESKEGYTLLSRKKAEYEEIWNELAELVKSKTVVKARINAKVNGGVVATFKGIRGFIPASQLLKEGETDLNPFINTDVDVTILQSDRKKRKIMFSKRFSKNRASREEIAKALDELEVGQVHTGTVESLKPFGAFIKIGSLEGLAHISELSWARVNHPSEVLKPGESVNVVILGVDREAQRVSLGVKQLLPDPWVKASEKYQIGQWVEGEVSRTVPFGAFVRIDADLEGLLHISEMASKRIEKIEECVQVGQKISVRIIKLSPQEQRVGLSLKREEVASEATAESEDVSTETTTQE